MLPVFLILVNSKNLDMLGFVDLHKIYIHSTSIAWRAMTTDDTFLLQVDSLKESQNVRMVWVGRDLNDSLVPNPYLGQGHFPVDQAAQSSV